MGHKNIKVLIQGVLHKARVYWDNTGYVGTTPVSCDYKQSMSRLLKITVGRFLIAYESQPLDYYQLFLAFSDLLDPTSISSSFDWSG